MVLSQCFSLIVKAFFSFLNIIDYIFIIVYFCVKQTGKEEVCNQYHFAVNSSNLLVTSVWCVFCKSAPCVIHCQTTRERLLFLLLLFLSLVPTLVWSYSYSLLLLFWHLLLCILPFWLLHEQESGTI